MKTENEKPKLKEINQLSPDVQNYSYGYCGWSGCGCGCGCGCVCGTGMGTGPNDCMPQEVFLELSDRGVLKTQVYVCGWGGTIPGTTIYGSCGSCGCGCGSCGCGYGSCGCGSGYGCGTGPNDCMPQNKFLELCDKGLLTSQTYVYVCGWGWTLPGTTIYGSCGSCGRLFNIDSAVNYLVANAQASSTGSCARAVRLALEAGGFNTDGRPNSEKSWIL